MECRIGPPDECRERWYVPDVIRKLLNRSFGGTYLEVKANEFLNYTNKFDDPNLPGEMITTVSLRKTIAGTEIKILQEGIPAVIPAEMCYLGWQESLEKLAKLIEPEIPDA